jgi:hypothetical protein
MELSNLTGTDYALDASGQAMDMTLTRSAASRVNRVPQGPFRLHAVFRPNLEDPNNTPLLDPPTLDDVTVLHDPPEGPGIRGWAGE